MFKHKSFVINPDKEKNNGRKPSLKRAAKIIEAKIVMEGKEPVMEHYDKNEPITLSLPMCLSSLNEEQSTDIHDHEDTIDSVISQAQSYDPDDEDYSDANAYFEEGLSNSDQQSYHDDLAYEMSSEDDVADDMEQSDPDKKEALKTHEAVVINPDDLPENETIAEDDKRFEEDIKAILTGKKQYDRSRVQKDPEEAIKDKQHGVMGKKNEDPIEEKLKNDHAIFDKIAQSMEMASSYDLGSIAMDKKFDTLEKETDEDFTKKIHELIDNDKGIEDQQNQAIDEVLDPAKKEVIDGAETEDVDQVKKKLEEDEKAKEQDKVETKDFISDLDKMKTADKDDNQELSMQSSFSSTISIKHRYLKSRVFAVSGSTVEVAINSHWEPMDCSELKELNVTLTKSIDYWPDSEHGTKTFRIGGRDTKTWTGLTPGNYYLTFYFVNDTNPHCELKGSVDVTC